MRNICINVVIGFAALLPLYWTGCTGQERPEGFPKIYPCEIKVTQEEVPLPGANVTLIFQGTERSWVVAGTTDAQGIAAMFTHGSYVGAPAGTYKVLVSKTLMEGAPTPEQRQSASYMGGMGTPFDLVDTLYKNQDTTPLKMEVKPGENSQTFEVGKEVKTKIKRI